MGEVYRATDTALERTVAVKLLADRYAQQDDARARFRREALAAARLSAAPTVVTVFDVAEHDGRPLIVMSSEFPCISMNLMSRARYSSGIQSPVSTWPPAWTWSRNSCVRASNIASLPNGR